MPKGTSSQRPRHARPFAILVVDDEPDVLESIQALLRAEDDRFEVLTAESGKRGIEVLDARRVDLILADYRMTPMDGIEFLVHARQRLPGVPRVMVTAYPDVNVAMAAINEGQVAGFFLKPLEPESLLTVVRNALNEREGRADRARALAQAVDAFRRASPRDKA